LRTAFIRELEQIAERDPRIWLLTGDLGYSIFYRGQPVTDVLAASVGPTILLVGLAEIFAIIGGLAIGAYAGWKRGDRHTYEQLTAWGYPVACLASPDYLKHLGHGVKTLTPEQLAYAASDVLHLHALWTKLEALLAREGRLQLAQACFSFLPTRAQLDLLGYEQPDIFAH